MDSSDKKLKMLAYIVTGLAFYWAWTLSMPMGSFAREAGLSIGLGALAASSTAAHIAAMAATLLSQRLWARISRKRALFPLLAGTVCGGSVLIFLGLFRLCDTWSIYTGGILGGIGSAGMLLSWAGLFANTPPSVVKTGVSCSLPCRLVMIVVCGAIANVAACLFIIAMPLASMVAFERARKIEHESENENEHDALASSKNANSPSATPWRLLAYCLLFCIPYGLFLGQLGNGEFDYPTAAFLACLISAIVIAVDFISSKDTVFKGMLPLSSAGLLLLAFITPNSHNAAGTFTLMGNTLFMVYIYTELALFASDKKHDPVRIIAMGDLAQSAGLVAGTVIGMLLMSRQGSVIAGTVISALYLALLVVHLFFSSQRDKKAGGEASDALLWNATEPFSIENTPKSMEDAQHLYDEMIRERCDDLAREKGLSKREGEVLMLLAQGASGPDISEKLFISQSTVKTHVKRIYSKLDIHSRGELMNTLASK